MVVEPLVSVLEVGLLQQVCLLAAGGGRRVPRGREQEAVQPLPLPVRHPRSVGQTLRGEADAVVQILKRHKLSVVANG